jgi:hypothetical protein
MRPIEKVFEDTVAKGERAEQDAYCKVIADFLTTCVKIGWANYDELQRILQRMSDESRAAGDVSEGEED